MKQEHFFDRPQNLDKFLKGFYIALAVVVVADLVMPNHPSFPWEGYPLFYGAFGFVAYSLVVYGSHYVLRTIVKRKEDYYHE